MELTCKEMINLNTWVELFDSEPTFKPRIDHVPCEINFVLSVLFHSRNCYTECQKETLNVLLAFFNYVVQCIQNQRPAINTAYNKICSFVLGCFSHHCSMYNSHRRPPLALRGHSLVATLPLNMYFIPITWKTQLNIRSMKSLLIFKRCLSSYLEINCTIQILCWTSLWYIHNTYILTCQFALTFMLYCPAEAFVCGPCGHREVIFTSVHHVFCSRVCAIVDRLCF